MKRSIVSSGGDEEGDETEQQPPSEPLPRRRQRLMLHAVDGIVPYLTPHLLRKCFPPPSKNGDDDDDNNNNLLLIGMQVRDTCVVPFYETRKERTAKNGKNNSSNNTNNGSSDKAEGSCHSKGKRKRETNKPRGYEFASSSEGIDSWMMDYPRVTVPVFELQFEVDGGGGGGNKDGNDAASPGGDPSKRYGGCRDRATDQQLLLATSKGRVALSPDAYYDILASSETVPASASSSSTTTTTTSATTVAVPLFDTIPPKSEPDDDRRKNNPYYKRKDHAVRRSKCWLEHFIDRSRRRRGQERDESNPTSSAGVPLKQRIWAPVVVDEEGEYELDDDGNLVAIHRKDQMPEANGGEEAVVSDPTVVVDGVTVVGWHHIHDSSKRREAIESIRNDLRPENLEIAVLSTHSLLQFLDAIRSGCTVIGTGLPTAWAHSHKAFVADISSWRRDAAVASKKTRRADDDGAAEMLDTNGCIDLGLVGEKNDVSSHPWFRDPSPIVRGCNCFTCMTHMRAYVYHLVCAKELLGEMLLFVHNLHHCLELLRNASDAFLQGKEEGFFEHLESQIPKPKD